MMLHQKTEKKGGKKRKKEKKKKTSVHELEYHSGKGIHLLIIISSQGEKLETKLGLQGEMEK
jgi:ethanolamine utilization microcompartment shell protein EutS